MFLEIFVSTHVHVELIEMIYYSDSEYSSIDMLLLKSGVMICLNDFETVYVKKIYCSIHIAAPSPSPPFVSDRASP